jgi:hypothetical protein
MEDIRRFVLSKERTEPHGTHHQQVEYFGSSLISWPIFCRFVSRLDPGVKLKKILDTVKEFGSPGFDEIKCPAYKNYFPD